MKLTNGRASWVLPIFFGPQPRRARARGKRKRAEGRLDERVAPFPFPRHRARPRVRKIGVGARVGIGSDRTTSRTWSKLRGGSAREGPWMGGRNGGAMGKGKRDTEKAAKKNKVVTMPRRDGGEGRGRDRKRQKEGSGGKAEERRRGGGECKREDGGEKTEEGRV